MNQDLINNCQEEIDNHILKKLKPEDLIANNYKIIGELYHKNFDIIIKLLGESNFTVSKLFNYCVKSGWYKLAVYLVDTWGTNSINYNSAFCLALTREQFSLCNYLIYRFPIDINHHSDAYLKILVKWGQLSTIYWLYKNDTKGFKFDSVFRFACVYNKLEIAQWLHEECGDKIKQVVWWSFVFAVGHNHIKLCKWLYHTFRNDIDLTRGNHLAFKRACHKGHLKLAKWIYQFIDFDIHENRDYLFRTACKLGHIEVMIWLYNFGEVDVNAQNDYAFRHACRNGHFYIVQWLFVMADINYNHVCDYAFRMSCRYGHTEIAKWLYDLGGVNIKIYNNYCFNFACKNGHLEIAEWLYSLEKFGVTDELFASSCKNGSLEMAKWLFDKNRININYELELAFRNACESGNVDLINWLDDKTKINISVMDDIAFNLACKKGDIRVVKWFITKDGENYSYRRDREERGRLIPIISNSIDNLAKKKDWEGILKRLNLPVANDENFGECSICYEKANIKTSCLHDFCVPCLFTWRIRNKDCAFCKQGYVLELGKLYDTKTKRKIVTNI